MNPYIPPPIPGQEEAVKLCMICYAAEIAYEMKSGVSHKIFMKEVEESTKTIARARGKHEERKALARAAYEAVINAQHPH